MKAVKKLFALLAVLWCTATMTAPARATGFQPFAEDTLKAQATLSINAVGLASCSMDVSSDSLTNRIEVVVSINRIDNQVPISLKPWALEGTRRVTATKTYYVAQGHDYQVTATITVRDSGGKLIESFTTKSSIVHY